MCSSRCPILRGYLYRVSISIMKNLVSDSKALSEGATIASREKIRECGECGQDKASYIQLLHLFHWDNSPYAGKENLLRKIRTEDEGEDNGDEEEGDKEKEEVRTGYRPGWAGVAGTERSADGDSPSEPF